MGWIMSPALNFQALGLTEPQNIFVQFDYCRWDGEQDDLSSITAENAGSMPETQLVKDHPKRTWQSIVFKVTDATSETRIKISGTKAGSKPLLHRQFPGLCLTSGTRRGHLQTRDPDEPELHRTNALVAQLHLETGLRRIVVHRRALSGRQ